MRPPADTPPSFLPLATRAVLAIGGPDRRPFLQGLITNDIARVGATAAIHAALLTPQGRILHDFMIVELGDTLLIDAEAAGAEDLARRLGAYRLRSKVTVARLADWGVAALPGLQGPATLGLPPQAGAARQFHEGMAFVDPRLVQLGGRVVAPAARIAALGEAGWARAAPEAYDALRLELGVPEGASELADALPMENGFDALGALDWKKGCYVGQEVTARMRYRGLVKKRLVPVRIDGTAPARGTAVTLDGAEVGELRGHAGKRGLALMRIDSLAAGARLRAGDATLEAETPAWLTADEDAAG
ncbi:MAG: YgfZ/GcvT domain-containing protein [Rhodospirillales bacterium]|jgi:folate-binding protein YgfZ